jgi:hypothetical protein
MCLASLFGLVLSEAPPNRSIAVAGLLSDWTGKTEDPFIYIGTADSCFHDVDILEGDLLWSVDTGGCIFGSTETGSTTYVPSLDGYFFTYVKNYGYRRVPLPIRDLVFFSPFRTEAGEIFTSGKSTRLFFIDENGEIFSEYRSNSTIPKPGSSMFKKDRLIIVRVDYELNVFDEESKLVKYSEFDIFTGHTSDLPTQNVRVTTSVAGGVTISVNGTITGQLKIPGYPVSVFGSNGKFDFQMNMNGQEMSKYAVAFMNLEGYHVAIPSRPLAAVGRSQMLQLPEQARGAEDRFTYGICDFRRPFRDFASIRPGDATRSADPFAESLEKMIISASATVFPYTLIGLVFLVIFAAIRLVDLLFEKLKHALKIGIRIVPDPFNPDIGMFNNAPCSLVRSSSASGQTLSILTELHLPGIANVRAFEGYDPGFLIAYPVLKPFDFGTDFVVRDFLAATMTTLSGLHENGYVHGSISESVFFLDSGRNLLIGRLEESIQPTRDSRIRAGDVITIARVVRPHLPAPEPLLIDLLDDMEDPDPLERPFAQEVLQHPYFWSGAQKVTLLCQFSDFLQSRPAHTQGLIPIFEGKRVQVVGDDWTAYLDQSLISDAIQHTPYSGRLASDLIRLIRNKWLHSPVDAKGCRIGAIGMSADDYFDYFQEKFPNLFIYVYYFVEKCAGQLL